METAASDVNQEFAAQLTLALESLHTDDCFYFPIRHHSPACAWHIERLIREVRPSAVLIEGPSSFTSLIPTILDGATKPPVAVYTQYVDTERRLYKPPENGLDLGPARFAAYYPFCSYSPELVALQSGNAVGARLRFIDLDYVDQILAEHFSEQQDRPRIESLMEERYLQESSYLRALAERSGCRDFNEMWDHLFEANFRERSTESFTLELASYCYFARTEASVDLLKSDGTTAREAAMAAAIAEERSMRKRDDGPIIIVTGGFHTVVLPQLVAAASKPIKVSKPSTEGVQQSLIRYSFEQLDALNGYSAGMPSPSFYERLWQELGNGRAEPAANIAAAILVEIGAQSRKRDMQIALSTADEIAALQQARLLAALRGHDGPTREDLLDGIRSCFVKGSMDAEGAVVMGVVSHVLTGKQIGEIPNSAGLPPIVLSFRKEAERARLDIEDSSRKRLSLEIYRKQQHRQTSRLLHSLNFLQVPFATMLAGPDFVRGTGLSRIHEQWQYAWTPMTDGALINAAVYGSTIEEAATNRLREAIARLGDQGQGRSATAAVAMLVLACRMGLHRHAGQLLQLIASRIAEESSFVEAVKASNQLLLLWQSREPLEAHTLPEIRALLNAAYVRSTYLLTDLANCPEDQLSPALDSLTSMRELLTADSTDLLDEELFWQSVTKVLQTNNQSHPPYGTICGAVAGLLFAANRIDQKNLDELVTGYLTGLRDAERRVGFLRGLLTTCREAAWQNKHLINSIDQVIASWREEEFISNLPNMRLAFANLTPRETDKVASLVASLHGNQDLGQLVQGQISEQQLEINRRLSGIVLKSLQADGLSPWLEGEAE